ncbi:methyl-accepting chemotaxis protein [Shewanella xiamenensis]|uniref:methyl-accepting chemotaxis protein n=1 Tax=Shewanella xiamenensis TaxID=332186 RepID=UPI000C12A837|nr:PAS domain-containing methyl-accepting chemotaxis protein [Shewanella xiamenensis]MBW0297215.1 chemotaxis protein [Shewanella xiamenensis]PHY62719.1 chemotaxis protein [Shewanella xiamenensis]
MSQSNPSHNKISNNHHHAQEIRLTPQDELISTTDTRGIITYVNQRFAEVSGYRAEELIGHQHNKVRHPDMPSAAFKEMWQKLKSGQSWRGIVKNRCKNGDFYWVDAFVSPVFENGTIVGYQSVRLQPQAAYVTRATAIYRRLLDNKSITKPLSLMQKRVVSAVVASTGLLIAGYLWGWGVIIAGAILMGLNLAIFYDEAFRIPAKLIDMQTKYDSISRYIYSGADTSSILDFQLILLQAKMNGVLGRTQDQANQLHAIADQLVVTTEQTYASLDQEKNQLEQLASAMEEMSSTITEVAQNTQRTSTSINTAYDLCLKSSANMKANTQKVEQLAKSVADAANNANLLNQEAERVASAMGEIDSIAEQTNLLALNAAIEAARAGEQGRGFAVVADEVRALSSRTQLSTNSISQSVDKMFSMLNAWAKEMEQSRQHAERCANDIQTSAENVNTIYQEVSEIHTFAQQNAVAADQQRQVVHEITNNIHFITQSSSENLAATHQIGDAANHLKHSAEKALGLRRAFG